MIKEAVYDAFYKLTDNRSQIRSYVFDVVRATVPNMFLDDVRAPCQPLASVVTTYDSRVANLLPVHEVSCGIFFMSFLMFFRSHRQLKA